MAFGSEKEPRRNHCRRRLQAKVQPELTGRIGGCALRRELHANRGTSFEKPVSQSPEKKNSDERGVEERLAHIGLHQPVVMNHATDSGDVDRAMKLLPALSAEAPNPTSGGSDCQGNQQHKTGEADGDKRPLGDVFPHRGEVEGLIGPEISKKVQAGVEESEEAEHPPETDEVRKLDELAEVPA